MRLRSWICALAVELWGCAPKPAAHPLQTSTAVPAPPNSCADALKRAAQRREDGYWARARDEFKSLQARCPERASEVAPVLRELDAALAVETPRRTATVEDLKALRTVRAARARRAPEAEQLAEQALASGGPQGELLAEIGLLRLAAAGRREAQPYFDRARLALEREAGKPAVPFAVPETFGSLREPVWAPAGEELWWFGGSAAGNVPLLVFDTATWEPVWQLQLYLTSNCTNLVLPGGAGYGRCDGIFARDGRELVPFPAWNRLIWSSLAHVSGDSRLLAARADGKGGRQRRFARPEQRRFSSVRSACVLRGARCRYHP
ncbi:MAG: hypothetical protein QM756_35915 [Polyangiaceae bacterium]